MRTVGGNCLCAIIPYSLVQERRNSIANALELCLSCTNPSMCVHQMEAQMVALAEKQQEETMQQRLQRMAGMEPTPVTPIEPPRPLMPPPQSQEFRPPPQQPDFRPPPQQPPEFRPPPQQPDFRPPPQGPPGDFRPPPQGEEKQKYPVARPYFDSLWPSDTIWRQRSGSTLAQVMACCLTAPSHYLNQC